MCVCFQPHYHCNLYISIKQEKEPAVSHAKFFEYWAPAARSLRSVGDEHEIYSRRAIADGSHWTFWQLGRSLLLSLTYSVLHLFVDLLLSLFILGWILVKGTLVTGLGILHCKFISISLFPLLEYRVGKRERKDPFQVNIMYSRNAFRTPCPPQCMKIFCQNGSPMQLNPRTISWSGTILDFRCGT